MMRSMVLTQTMCASFYCQGAHRFLSGTAFAWKWLLTGWILIQKQTRKRYSVFAT